MGNNITKPLTVISKYENMDKWNTDAQFIDPIWFNLLNHQSLDMRFWPSGIYFFNMPFTQDILYTLYVTLTWTFFFLCWFLWDLWTQTKFAA